VTTTSTRLPVLIALNNIRSLHNVGAIFRSADGVNAEGIILGGLTPKPPRHEIEKTALGATATVPWEYRLDLKSALLEYKKRGYSIYALEQTEKSTNLFETTIKFPCVIVAGHEKEGVERGILDMCDGHVELPMLGESAKSLNVSTATSIALYSILTR
jgi:tRNA G18 (ribose-2'-O)-methylase SpoU